MIRMMTVLRVAALAGLALAAGGWPHVLSAQTLVTSTDSTPCRGCTLIIDSVLTLGGKDEPGGLFMHRVNPHHIVRLQDGRFVVSEVLPLQVFDPAGRPLPELGRQGQGPGEFPRVPFAMAVGPRGHVFMFVPWPPKVLEFDASLNYRRMFTLESRALYPVVLSDGKIAGLRSRPGGVPHGQVVRQPLFTMYDSSGRVIRQVGHESTNADELIAAGPAGTVWTGKLAPYELREWSQSGELLRIIKRTTPFMDARAYLPRGPYGLRQALVVDMRFDSQGRLWVVIVKRKAVRPPEAEAISQLGIESWVEVLDVATGALIASARLPLPVSRLLDDSYMSSNLDHGLPLGPELRIFRARLVVPPVQQRERRP